MNEQVPSKERDLSEYLGKDRDELRAIIGERDAEIERLTRNCGEVAAAYVLRQHGAPSRPFTPEEARAYRSFIEEYFGPAHEPEPALMRALWNKAVILQDGAQGTITFETEQEANTAFDYLTLLGNIGAGIPPDGAPSMPTLKPRACTCHPDDNPPRPCPQRYALSECRRAAQPPIPGPGMHPNCTDPCPICDREDAERWRALRNCARITAMGSAGCKPNSNTKDAHLTLNFWTHNERETETYPREWLDVFVSKALRATATKPGEQA